MSDEKSRGSDNNSNSWFSINGPENDVVLSTRVRFARNLANFPFVKKIKGDDAERVRSIIFDAFSHFENADLYTAIINDSIAGNSAAIFSERGIIDHDAFKNEGAGLVFCIDGKTSCAINDVDHIRISSMTPGLDGTSAFAVCQKIDDQLQNNVQFAANYELGYLNSSIADTGSGMKVSCRVHLPSLSFSGKLKTIIQALNEKGISFRDCFGAGNISGTSLGFYYQISSTSCGEGNEIDQLANLISGVKFVVENERREREVVLRTLQTKLRDRIFRSLAAVKFASLIQLKEAIEILSDIKWGRNLGFFSDISDSEFCALLYRIQDGHLYQLLKSKNINFPRDISENMQLKVEYLRTILLQETFEKLKVN